MVKTSPNPKGAVATIGEHRHPVIGFEKKMLAAVLHSKVELTHDYGLKPESFLMPRHREMWRGILELLKGGNIIDAYNLCAWASAYDLTQSTGGHHYIHDVLRDESTFSASTSDLTYIASQILDAHRIRSVRQALVEQIQAIDAAPERSSVDVAAETEAKIFESTRYLANQGFKSIADSAQEYFVEFERRVAVGGKPVGIPIGLPAVDKITQGFKPGDFVGLMGDPGQGKSAFLTNTLNYYASREIETAVFSMEMSRSAIMDRMVSAKKDGTITLTDLKRGEPTLAPIARDQMQGLTSMHSIHISDEKSISVEGIASDVRRLIALRGRIDVVVIDHVHIIETGEDNLDKTARKLKALAMELNIVIIGLLHLSAGVGDRKDKRPQLSDIKFKLAGHFDVVMGLYRDEYYYGNESDELGMAEVIVRKHRDGCVGTAKVGFVAEYTRFTSIFDDGSSGNIVLPWQVDEEIERLKAKALAENPDAAVEAEVMEVVEEDAEYDPSVYGEPDPDDELFGFDPDEQIRVAYEPPPSEPIDADAEMAKLAARGIRSINDLFFPIEQPDQNNL